MTNSSRSGNGNSRRIRITELPERHRTLTSRYPEM
jgi:hypothetical protein